jgi:polar amino acid transport system permease protein
MNLWDWEYAWESLPTLLRGLLVTIEATVLAAALALILGAFWAVFSFVRVPVLSKSIWWLVEFFRGTPLLVQLYFFFYVFPEFGIAFSPFVTGVIGLGLYSSAYTSEVYRAGIMNVDRGQLDAAQALRIPPLRRWTDIILPQAIRSVTPALGNYVIVMFKYTPILALITVNELMRRALNVGSLSFRYIEPMTMVGVLFLLISIPAMVAIRRIEARGHRMS